MSIKHKWLRRLSKTILYNYTSLTHKWRISGSYIHLSMRCRCNRCVLEAAYGTCSYFLYVSLSLFHKFYKFLVSCCHLYYGMNKVLVSLNPDLPQKERKERRLRNCYTCQFLRCLIMSHLYFKVVDMLFLPWDYRLFVSMDYML